MNSKCCVSLFKKKMTIFKPTPICVAVDWDCFVRDPLQSDVVF